MSRSRYIPAEDQQLKEQLFAILPMTGTDTEYKVSYTHEGSEQLIADLIEFITADREAWAQAHIEKYLTDLWGERCKTTDKEDFPDTDYSDPKNDRCACCEAWEQYDEWREAQS